MQPAKHTFKRILSLFKWPEPTEVQHVEVYPNEPSKLQLHIHTQIRINAIIEQKKIHKKRMAEANIPAIENFFSKQNKKV